MPFQPLSKTRPEWTTRLAPGASWRRMALAPQTQNLFCLPPGHALLCLEGRIEIQHGPNQMGDVLVSRSTQQLEEGGFMLCEPHGSAMWLTVHAPGQAGAEIALIQPAPSARLAAMSNGVRRFLAWMGLKSRQPI